MKILLDENIDVNFCEEFPEYEISTVKDNNWTGIENGKLLELALKNGYEAFITQDSNLQYQQNLAKYKIHIIVLKLKDSRLSGLKILTPKIKLNLNKAANSTEFGIIEISL